MAKAVDCKSTIPGSNPGGASLKAATLNRVAAFFVRSVADHLSMADFHPTKFAVDRRHHSYVARDAEFLRETDDVDSAQVVLQSALNTAQTIVAKRRRPGLEEQRQPTEKVAFGSVA